LLRETQVEDGRLLGRIGGFYRGQNGGLGAFGIAAPSDSLPPSVRRFSSCLSKKVGKAQADWRASESQARA
jgi:hypothetical protein